MHVWGAAMRERLFVVVLVSTGLSAGSEYAHAQSAPRDVNLPAIVVSPTQAKPKTRVVRTAPRSHSATRPVAARNVAAAPPANPTPGPAALYPTTPIPGSGIDPDKVPSFVNTVDANQIAREHSPNITDALEKFVPGIDVYDVA